MVDISTLTDEQLDQMIQQRKSRSISELTDDQLNEEISKARFNAPRPIPEISPDADTKTFGEAAGDIGDFLIEEGPVIGGGAVGAFLGTPGGPPGMALGATLGGSSGEGLKQVGQQFGVLPGEPPKTSTEASERIIDSGLLMGAGEVGGQALIAPFSKLSKGFSRNVTPEGRETLEFFKGTGITPNPAKVTDSRILDLASNAGEASIFGGEKFLQGQIKAVDFVDQTINNLVGSLGKNKETLGILFSDAVNNTSQAFRGTAKTLFDRLDQQVGTRFVDTAGIRRNADGLIEELTGLNVEPSLIRNLQSAGRTSVGSGGLQQTGLRFSEAQRLRSDLLALSRRSKDVISDKAVGRVNRIVGTLEQQMESVARNSGEGVLQQWRKANKFWKDGINTFNAKVIKDIMNKDPDAAVSALFTAGRDKPVMIRRIKRALKNKTLIRDFENATLKNILFKSTDELGEIVPKKLLNQIKAFGGVDGQALKTMFPRGEDKLLSKLARIKGVLLKGQPDATGRFAVQIGQVTAGAGVVTGQFRKAALAILIVPDMIARAFRNPAIARFITEGSKARPGTKQAVTFTTRLAALLAKEGIEHQRIEGGTDISPTRENARILQQQQGAR